MKIEKIRVDKIYIAQNDYKITESKLLVKLENLLKKYGQLTPILLWKDNDSLYKIIDGGRIYIAALSLGMEYLDAVIIDNIEDSIDADLLRIIYGQFKFDYDVIKLIELMHIVMEKYTISQLELLLPFTEEELNSYKNLFNFDWAQFATGTTSVKTAAVPIKNKKMF